MLRKRYKKWKQKQVIRKQNQNFVVEMKVESKKKIKERLMKKKKKRDHLPRKKEKREELSEFGESQQCLACSYQGPILNFSFIGGP